MGKSQIKYQCQITNL